MSAPSPDDLDLLATREELRSARDPALLQAFLESRGDPEVLAVISGLGADTFLEPCFAAMSERFLPEAADGRAAVVQLDIVVPEGIESWHIRIGDGKCITGPGLDRDATITGTMGITVFLRIAAGMISGAEAFLDGKVKIKGDLMLGQRMLEWFEIPEAP